MYRLLDSDEIKDLLDVMPEILKFNSYEEFNEEDVNFTNFGELPDDIKFKIANMSSSSNIFKTEKIHHQTK